MSWPGSGITIHADVTFGYVISTNNSFAFEVIDAKTSINNQLYVSSIGSGAVPSLALYDSVGDPRGLWGTTTGSTFSIAGGLCGVTLDEGINHQSADHAVGLLTSGVERLSVSNSAVTSTVPVMVPDGALAAPGIAFAGSPSTGMYRTFNDVYLVHNGAAALQASTTYLRTTDHQPIVNSLYGLGNSLRRWSVVYANNGTIQTSDARMKHSVQDLGLGLAFVESLRPVTFTWNDTVGTNEATGEVTTITHSRRHTGLIAQEVHAAIEAAGETLQSVDIVDNDALVPGAPDDALDQYGMRYTQLVPVLIKAVQELSARVAALEAA